jgi:hypothetical protein
VLPWKVVMAAPFEASVGATEVVWRASLSTLGDVTDAGWQGGLSILRS